jgi:hypothetical protein
MNLEARAESSTSLAAPPWGALCRVLRGRLLMGVNNG